MRTVPTLLDCARICVVVRSTVPRSWASLIVRSATSIVGGRWKMSVGRDDLLLAARRRP